MAMYNCRSEALLALLCCIRVSNSSKTSVCIDVIPSFTLKQKKLMSNQNPQISRYCYICYEIKIKTRSKRMFD